MHKKRSSSILPVIYVCALIALSSCGQNKKQSGPGQPVVLEKDKERVEVPVQTPDFVTQVSGNNFLIAKIKQTEVRLQYAFHEEKKIADPVKKYLPMELDRIKQENTRFGTDSFIVFIQQDKNVDFKTIQMVIDIFRDKNTYKFKLLSTTEEIQQLEHRLKAIKDTLSK